MDKRIYWTSLNGEGKEELTAQFTANAFIFTSTVTGGDSDLGTKWDASYTITCDTSWRTREVEITEHLSGKKLSLQSDREGNWLKDGQPVAFLQGCIDVDFRATPFSNTLPIRRLQLEVGESAHIEVVYINAPDLALSREKQVYTKLTEHIWRFEQPSADFTAEVTVDDEGFVLEYPGLFHRV